MFCSRCGAQVGPDARVCSQCGEVLGPAAPPAAVLYNTAPFIPRPGIKAETGRWISAGWEMVTADLGNFALLGLIFMLVNSVASIVTQGPLQLGMHLFCIKKMFNKRAEVGDMFKGFDYFLPAFVAGLIIGVFVFAGMLLCVIPGLVVAGMYKFTYLFIVDKKMDFWPAMEASHSVVKNDYFGFTMFLLAMGLVNLLGLLCCVVGLVVTIPMSVAAITIAYQECVGFEQRTVDAL
jgi:uncharacterized membrane protein